MKCVSGPSVSDYSILYWVSAKRPLRVPPSTCGCTSQSLRLAVARLFTSGGETVSSLPTGASQIMKVPVRESKIEGKPSSSHDAPLPKGDRNENPNGIGLFALLLED